MQIDGIQITNFLSFDKFSWSGLDPQLNIIVGPNGAGKTNFFHALRAVKDSLSMDQRQDVSSWSQSIRHNLHDPTSEIALNIRFIRDWEKQLLCTFVAASLCNERLIQESHPGQFGPNELVQYSNLLLEIVRPEDISWLFSGRFVASYNGLNWSCRYSGTNFNLSVKGLNNSSFIAGTAWNELIKKLHLKLDKEGHYLPRLQDVLKRSTDAAGGHILQIERPNQAVLPTHQAFEQLAGIKLQKNQNYGMSFVFQTLFEHIFVFTDNVRYKPLYNFSQSSFHAPHIDLSNGEQMALYLFKKKNGTVGERKQYIATQQMFTRLTNRNFDVGLSNLDKPGISLDIHLIGAKGDIPLEFSGAGIAEALFFSTLITASTGQVILLDEPALTTHATIQRALLHEIQTHTESGNQCIIATHSPMCVPSDAIMQVARFAMHHASTTRFSLDTSKMRVEEITRMEKELRDSTDTRSLLFSRAVILVENEFEQGAFPIWFEKKLKYNLENHNILVRSVDGDNNFEKFIFFLHQYGIPWAIICNGPVIGDRIVSGTRSRMIRELNGAGISNLPNSSGKTFAQLCLELETHGIFTHAKDVKEEIESLPNIQSRQQEAKDQVGESKGRQGRYIATYYSCPYEVAVPMEKAIKYLQSMFV